MKKIITYFGQQVKIACDEKCHKAWGINHRPKIQFSADEDDVVYLSDKELGRAPKDPHTYENGHAKPVDKKEIPNKWCIGECERCAFEENSKLELPDFSKRRYNIPSKHE